MQAVDIYRAVDSDECDVTQVSTGKIRPKHSMLVMITNIITVILITKKRVDIVIGETIEQVV